VVVMFVYISLGVIIMATASVKGDAKEDAPASEVARLKEENEQLKKRYAQLLRDIGVVATDADESLYSFLDHPDSRRAFDEIIKHRWHKNLRGLAQQGRLVW